MALCLILLAPSVGAVFADDSKTDYDAEIKAAQSKASGIQADLEASLTTVNQVYQKAYASKQAVADGESKIAELTSQIAKTDEEIKAREVVMAEQMRQAQTDQAQITDLSSSKAAEEKRQADAAAREKAKATAEPKPSQPANVGQPSSNPDTSNTGGSSPTPITPDTPSGNSMTVSTTGYSSDGADGMTPGHITATGIDLWVNPMCVAVDPSVIPLGSMVEVPGYGIAIAGDTGGAIKGYKVDLHFKTTKEAINWGRRTVTIKVLS